MSAKLLRAFTGPTRRATIQDLLLLITAAVAQAFTFNLFLASSDAAPGGVAALSIILHHYTGISYGLLLLGLSILPIALGFRYLGRFQFLIRVALVTLIYTLGTDYVARFLPAGGITDDPLLNALFGGVIGGIASGMAFLGRGTFAGTGILSRIIQLRTGIPLTQIYMVIDGSIILLVGLVFGWENALYSLIMLFVWGLATDYVLEGPSVVRTAFIITDEAQAVSQALMARMGIGVTRWTGQGMFTAEERSVLFCTVSRPDVKTLNTIVAEIDPAAFVVIGQGHSAHGGMLRQAGRKTKAPKSL
ncbi:MAG: YitT family protein [Caldilineales bacterium]|nr:YitT family protein [Caldilineales bacterium]